MKKTITLLSLLLIASFGMSQVVFQSDLSSWGSGVPTDFYGTKTSLDSANCTEVTTGAMHGSSFANLVNTGSGHKRFTTQAVTVVPGQKYIIEMWVAHVPMDTAELRVSMYDLTNSSWTTYTSYQNVTGTTLVKYTDSVVAPTSCTSLEFMLSFRNTNALGIGIDSVSIFAPMGPPPPPPSYSVQTIYDIQYTTAASGDSPFDDSLVETTGIVTASFGSGYFIQDGTTAWNGVYVYDNTNTPNRGDEITIKGKVTEYFDLTEIVNVDTLITISTGNTLPAPIAVTTSSIKDEMYEGLLVKVSGVMCVDSNAGYGEWDVQNPSMDTLAVNDLIFDYTPVQYQGYDITGLVNYNFSEFKLEPRDSADIVQSLVVSIIESADKLSVKLYPNPVQNTFTLSGVDLERAEIFTTTGKLVKSVSLNSLSTVDVSDLVNGAYIVKVYNSTNNSAVSRFVKQ